MAYSRSTILINKRFQLRFAAYVCLWLTAICFVYPLITANLFDYLIRFATQDPMGPELSGLLQTRKDVLTLLVLTEAAFLIMTFMVCIFISHRIAGPVFKLRRSLLALGSGSWNGKLIFRSKDWFPELAEDFNHMVAGIEERNGRESEMLTSAISRVESAMNQSTSQARQELDRALSILKKMQDQRKQGGKQMDAPDSEI